MKLRLTLALLALLLAPAMASADTVTVYFNVGPLGMQGTSVTSQGVTVTGWVWNGSAYVPANLWRRDDPNDHGLGVCSEGEPACLETDSANELDNLTDMELILITIPNSATWVSIQLSSLDCNESSPCTNPEFGQMYATNGNDPNTAIWTWFLNYSGGGLVEPIIGIPGNIAGGYTTIALYPYDWTGQGGTNNDHLLYAVTYEVPEPGTLLLLGTGLFGMVGISRPKSIRP